MLKCVLVFVYVREMFMPVIVWFEGSVFADAHVLGLIIWQLCEVCVKYRQVKAGHVFIWKYGDTKIITP